MVAMWPFAGSLWTVVLLIHLCRLQFLEDASSRAVESISNSRETTSVVVPADSATDQ